MYDLIVIGAGPGGYEAALHAARSGKKTLLIEKEYIGGTCLNVGCIPTKTLLHSAKIYSLCKESELYGIKTENTSIDMAVIRERKNRIVHTLTRGVENSLKKAQVDVINGHAVIAAHNKVSVNNKEYETYNILIATGSNPLIPPIPGIDSDTILDSTGILNLKEIPETLGIIGGGAIGLEFACFFAETETKVTVIEMLPRIIPGADEEISKLLKNYLTKKGITFHLSSKVMKINTNEIVFIDGDNKEQKQKFDIILNATGRTPHIKNLGLEELHIDMSEKGIYVDDAGKTNVPGIWACGDVTGRCLLAHAATREGIVAVNNMFGKKDMMRYTGIPFVIYTHPEVAYVGKTEEELKNREIEYIKKTTPMVLSGRYVIEHEKEKGMIKVLVGKKYGEILGIHIIGSDASEMIFGAAAVIETEMRIDDIKEIIFPHPTISEALKEAIIHIQ